MLLTTATTAMRAQASPSVPTLRVSDFYRPIPKIVPFHQSRTKYRAIAGGIGSGKSVAGVAESIIQCLLYPGNVHAIVRRTFADLEKSTLLTFLNLCPTDLIDWTASRKKPCVYKFRRDARTGRQSEIRFIGLDEYRSIKSVNLGSFFADEGTEFDPDLYQFLEGRLRQQHGPRRGWMCTNVEGKDPVLFDHYHPRGKYYRDDHELWTVTTLDNPHLPKDYVDSLLRMPDTFRRRYVYADFSIFQGQIYPNFSERTNVLQPFDVPPQWHRYRVIDHGMSTNPTVCVWLAVDRDGNVFVYREYEAVGKLIGENAEEIKRLSGGENYIISLCDPSMFARNMQGKHGWVSVADLYYEAGITLAPGDNSQARFARLASLIEVDKERIHPITQQLGAPRFFVFGSCPCCISELEDRQWKQPGLSRVDKEVPKEGGDDHVDCLEYFANYWGAMGFTPTPAPVKPRPWYEMDAPNKAADWVANF